MRSNKMRGEGGEVVKETGRSKEGNNKHGERLEKTGRQGEQRKMRGWMDDGQGEVDGGRGGECRGSEVPAG